MVVGWMHGGGGWVVATWQNGHAWAYSRVVGRNTVPGLPAVDGFVRQNQPYRERELEYRGDQFHGGDGPSVLDGLGSGAAVLHRSHRGRTAVVRLGQPWPNLGAVRPKGQSPHIPAHPRATSSSRPNPHWVGTLRRSVRVWAGTGASAKRPYPMRVWSRA